ncbi:C1-like protein [Corchorus olitorius]|uniref:C1-like protein n=1 Tax=Corchorus olitorius TaxID=93759 RepID=A0A1R3HEF0_9ROSI|nr:C1-like protein [Corchorus olitorius]
MIANILSSSCKIHRLTPEDVLSPRMIKVETHEHSWTLLSRPITFTCDFCGTDGDRTPYLCTTCDLIVHKSCIPLPHRIMIMRHHHPISHVYYLQDHQSKVCRCRICYKEVNTGYGSYHCSASNCNYIAHVNCATHKSIWDGSVASKDEEGMSEGESMNLITHVFQTMHLGEDVIIPTEIKHAYHDHKLFLTLSGEGEAEDDSNNCDGCMRPISVPFYGCKQCDFCLHKDCAELFIEKQPPSHKHLLVLTKNKFRRCDSFDRYHHGFIYKCNTSLYTLEHPSHNHPLFLDHNCQGNCNGCCNQIQVPSLAYRCIEGCEFILDFSCLMLPQEAWYKYDKHPLLLAYHDDSDPNQCYCDLCEEERNQKQWFYFCAKCDNSVHTKCILGDLPFIKLVSFALEQALECKESECNFIIHWECHESFPVSPSRSKWKKRTQNAILWPRRRMLLDFPSTE